MQHHHPNFEVFSGRCKATKFIFLVTSPMMRLGLLTGFQKLGFDTGCFPHHSWMDLDETEGSALLTQCFDDAQPDYLILSGYAPKYFGIIPDLCKQHGAGFIYWATEDPVGFDQTLFLAQKADFVFTTTLECIPDYRQHGIYARLLLFACSPEFHQTGQYNADYDVDLALAASFYSWEARIRGLDIILDAAKESGGSLKVWGAGWLRKPGQDRLGNPEYYRGYLPNDQFPDLCASAKIILGIQCDDSSETQTSMRPYEVLGCRGFHLAQWTKATVSLFKDGKHLVTAATKEEALDKIRFYLSHPDERSKIAEQGQQYVYAHHTYEHRVRDVILPRLSLKTQ